MRLLVIAQAYPTPEAPATLRYVHTRNLYYASHGVEVDVVNFSALENYTIDGIAVYTAHTIKKQLKAGHYALLVSHAPNVRNHYRFIRRYEKLFPGILFFFHGHEVLPINKVYPAPYPYVQKQRTLRYYLQNSYDTIKLWVWRRYFNRKIHKIHLIFVSKSLMGEFTHWVRPKNALLRERAYVIYNSVGEAFEQLNWQSGADKKYDFVTIRSFLDGASYSVDIVNNLAWKHPEFKFLLYGKGTFFDHYEKAPNLEWRAEQLDHEHIVNVLNTCRCALMPTRRDTQGVMSCEMATFGMPLITSDIPVCHEIFDSFDNVAFIDNTTIDKVDLKAILDGLEGRQPVPKNRKYSYSNVCGQELEIIKGIIDEQSGC